MLRHRIEELEKTTPGEIVLTLEDDTRLHYNGTVLEFLMEAKKEFRAAQESGSKLGPLADAVLRCVHASPNVGKLHELMRAVWIPILEERGEG